MLINEKTIDIRRTARYYMLGEPGPRVRDVWFACHGYGQLAREFLQSFTPLDSPEHLVVAPAGLHRFYLRGGAGKVGASWRTREDRENEIRDYTVYLDDLYTEIMGRLNPQTVRINILGFSQGTATAGRWAMGSTIPMHRLILWSGDFPPDTHWKSARRRLEKMEVFLVLGKDDPYMPPQHVQRVTDLLYDHNVRFHVKHFDGHHEIAGDMLLQLAQK